MHSNQLLFCLRVVGMDWFFFKHKDDPNNSIRNQIHNYINSAPGRLAVSLPVKYENGLLVCADPDNTTVEKLKDKFATIGCIIPTQYQQSVDHCLRYLEMYGRYYLFSEMNDTLPLTFGKDIWLNPYLETCLNRTFTDYDLGRFSFISEEDTRPEKIRKILEKLRPAGWFFIRSGCLVHIYKDQSVVYDNEDAIKFIAQDGNLYFRGKLCDRIGLYQLAFMFKPELWIDLHNIEPTQETRNLYNHFLQQIAICENKEGSQKIRFSHFLSEFNDDLDRSHKAITLM